MNVLASGLALAGDAVAVFSGFLVAVWLRFFSGFFVVKSWPSDFWFMYGWHAAVSSLLFLFVFQAVKLYVRPQLGGFSGKVPRLIRALGWGMLLATATASAFRTSDPYSRGTLLIAAVTVGVFVFIERYALFRFERFLARRAPVSNRVIIVGTDAVAARLRRSLEGEPRRRARVVGFIRTDAAPADADIPQELIRGQAEDLDRVLDSHPSDQIVVTDGRLGHQRVIELILACERNLIMFNMVPDMYRIMTCEMDMEMVDDIPLMGVSRWPLDYFWNRTLKRIEDVAGALAGLVVTAPVMAVAALLVKRSSPGPVFFRQERCGEKGRTFTIYKLRTMRQDAEKETGPVWAVENDPRRTRVGAFLRRHNIDELPQLWNVLLGDMSLVGPRPERPHFVEQFKEDIARYMWRHVSKPGMTGWAQVNGLRGNTSIEERIKYDLYYLENWSVAFDFKILMRTVFARKNAY